YIPYTLSGCIVVRFSRRSLFIPSQEEFSSSAFQFLRRCEINCSSSSPVWTNHERTTHCHKNRHEATLISSKARSDNPRVKTVDRDPCALQLFCQLIREENVG